MSETAESTGPVEDLEPIVPHERRIEVNGTACRIRRLKTREFLALMQVLTAGFGPNLGQVQLDFTDGDTISRDLSALMLLAVPNAVEEFTVFLRTIVEPLDGRAKGKVAAYLMDNPDLDVMLDIFEGVVVQEKDDLAVLAGKAQAMWSRLSSLFTPSK